MSYFWRRIGSYIIDLSIISMLSQVVFSIFGQYLKLTGSNLVYDIAIVYVFIFIAVAIAVGYNVGCYHYFKFPLGKLLMSIKVYDENGNRVPTKVYAKREANKYIWTYATLGIYPLYQFLRYVTKRDQTFHERQSKTHIFI